MIHRMRQNSVDEKCPWCADKARQVPHLALQAEAEVLIAGHRGLVDADAQAAVPSRERRRHDLLKSDHLPEELKVAHLPRELSAACAR